MSEVKITLTDGFAPERATAGAAGYDLRAAEDRFISSRGVSRVRLGFKMQLPEGWEAQIRSRSGLAYRGVVVTNSPGTIDPDYRGEVCVLMHALPGDDRMVARGERIAQMVFSRFVTPDVETVERLTPTERGEGGFGSTGET